MTIDRDIQRIVERSAERYLTKGAVVVMDPADGDVLAMASFPTFQPEQVASLLEDEDGALLNRALAAYNCGSVFKLVSAAAALEAGHLQPLHLHRQCHRGRCDLSLPQSAGAR